MSESSDTDMDIEVDEIPVENPVEIPVENPVEVPIANNVYPKESRRRGIPYDLEMRERIITALKDGISIRKLAMILSISRQTIHRIKKAWEANPDEIPKPKPKGGFRKGKIDRETIQAISDYALANPKVTLQEIRRALKHGTLKVPAIRVNTSTISRALHKAGLKHKTLRHIDPAVFQKGAISRERLRFRQHQRIDPKFAADHLLFFDESTFFLNEQTSRGWGATNSSTTNHLLKLKGRTQSTYLFLTIGIHRNQANKLVSFVNYKMFSPSKQFPDERRPLITEEESKRFYSKSGEFLYGKPLMDRYVGLNLANVESRLLKDILKAFCVKTSDTKPVLWNRLEQLARTGPRGLPKSGGGLRDTGGRKVAFKGSTFDVAYYFEKDCIPAYKKQLAKYGVSAKAYAKKSHLVWDNAPTHSAVDVLTTDTVSVFHRLTTKDWRLGGVFYTPPRSPAFNPVESAFAYIKHRVRKKAPDMGYKQEDLERTIRHAIRRIRKSPKTLQNWIVKSCKYRYKPLTEEEAKENAERKQIVQSKPIYADAHGTVHSQFHEGDVDIAVKAKPLPDRAAETDDDPPLRYAGYGPRPLVGVGETEAPLVKAATVGENNMYIPEMIEDEKREEGKVTHYLIKWQGYENPKDRTWEPAESIANSHGFDSILYRWTHDIRNASKCKPNKTFLKDLLGERKYLALQRDYKGHQGVRIVELLIHVNGRNIVVSEPINDENRDEVERLRQKRKEQRKKTK